MEYGKIKMKKETIEELLYKLFGATEKQIKEILELERKPLSSGPSNLASSVSEEELEKISDECWEGATSRFEWEPWWKEGWRECEKYYSTKHLLTPTNVSSIDEKELEDAANAYAKERGDDCLRARNHPGTPVGECIHIFCGCDIYDGFKAGYRYAKTRAPVMPTEKEFMDWYFDTGTLHGEDPSPGEVYEWLKERMK
jgi:hypothetical protein